MKMTNYKVVYNLTVFGFIVLFFFLNNDWKHRIALLVLAATLLGVIKLVPRKFVGFCIIMLLVVFKIVDMLLISK